MISHYLGQLAHELDFDPSLSRQVTQEVEDHLWQAVESDPVADRLAAERRAVAKFGDPRDIAAQFAAVSLAAHARRVGLAAVLVIAAVFIVMKARLAWSGVVPLPLAEETRALLRPLHGPQYPRPPSFMEDHADRRTGTGCMSR